MVQQNRTLFEYNHHIVRFHIIPGNDHGSMNMTYCTISTQMKNSRHRNSNDAIIAENQDASGAGISMATFVWRISYG